MTRPTSSGAKSKAVGASAGPQTIDNSAGRATSAAPTSGDGVGTAGVEALPNNPRVPTNRGAGSANSRGQPRRLGQIEL